jgi:alkylhydroperoxidase family enzyme
MTATIQLRQRLFDQLMDVGFSSQEIIEITATVAACNFTCRFVLALDVGEGIAGAPAWFKEL